MTSRLEPSRLEPSELRADHGAASFEGDLAEFERLADAISALPDAYAAADPHDDWQAAVFAALPAESAEPLVERQQQEGRVIRGPWGRRVAAGVVLALAATVALVVLRPSAPIVPEYQLELHGGRAAEVRAEVAGSAVGAVAVLDSEARFELRMRPQTTVEGAIAIRGAIIDGDRVRPWSPPARVWPDGAAVIEGRAAEVLGVPPGTYTLVIAIGRAEVLPNDPAMIAHPPDDAAWRTLRRVVRLEGP